MSDPGPSGVDGRLGDAMSELAEACDELVRLAGTFDILTDLERLVEIGPPRKPAHILRHTDEIFDVGERVGRVEARALDLLVVFARLEVRRLHELTGGRRVEYGDFKAFYAQGASMDAVQDLLLPPGKAVDANRQQALDTTHAVVASMLRRLILAVGEDCADLAAVVAEGNARPCFTLLYELRELVGVLRVAQRQPPV